MKGFVELTKQEMEAYEGGINLMPTILPKLIIALLFR